MRRRALTLAVAAVVIAVVAVAAAPRVRVAWLAALLLLEVPTPETDGPIAARLPDPVVEQVTYEAGGRAVAADVYRPRGRGPHPGIVLSHGVAAGGKRDLRLVNFADALARCGYVALVPEFTDIKELRVRPSDVDDVVRSFEYLASQPDVDDDRVGLFGFSYAGGLAVLAAADPAIAEKVRFCFLLGTYYDLGNIVTFATTGCYRRDGEWARMEPRHTGKWTFLKNMLELVDDAGDRALLSRIADARLAGTTGDVSAHADSLGPEGLRLYTLMTNEDPDRAQALIESLSPRILDYFDALSLPGNIDNVAATLIIVHGRDDNLMPYTESVLLAEHAPPGAVVRLRLLDSFQHVDLTLNTGSGPLGWIGTVAEAGRVFSVAYDLLAEGLL